MTKVKTQPWATIKVPRETYEAARRILEQVSTQGWASIGSTRTDAPTLGAVFADVFARGAQITPIPKASRTAR
jgi:hypothetical protein